MQEVGCSRGLEKGTWRAKGRTFRSLENTGISIATLYHFWQHLGQAVEVCSNDEAGRIEGGQVGPGEVPPVVTAIVQTGNTKIAAYGAAVQRNNENCSDVLQAIVDGKLYISYWCLTIGTHKSGLDFMTQNHTKAALARATQAAALAPTEPQAETPPPTANGILQEVEDMAKDNAEDNVAIGNAKQVTGELAGELAKAAEVTETEIPGIRYCGLEK